MKNSGITEKRGALNELPDGFDQSKVVGREWVRRPQGNSIHLSRCDYDPIARNRFNGWFAFPDTKDSGIRRSKRIARIVDAGGICVINMVTRRGCEPRSARVRILEAYQDMGNIVVHIRPEAADGRDGGAVE